MPTPRANIRRRLPGARIAALVSKATAVAMCAVVAAAAGTPTARAAGARELLAGAIANTRGSYLVYNFGSGFPAPMLNAAGNWYELSNGGRLMIDPGEYSRLYQLAERVYEGYADYRDKTADSGRQIPIFRLKPR